MTKIRIAPIWLMLLSILVAHQANGADEFDGATPPGNPRKVDMRPVQVQNSPANMTGKNVITAEQVKAAAVASGKLGKNDNLVIVDQQPDSKTGKFLPSNRNSNAGNVQTVQIPGVGEVMIQGSEKKNAKNINQRSDEIMGSGDKF
jgi:hypothetical protein